MTMTKQPNYNASSNKFSARKSNKDIYYFIKNENKIPENKFYQTLCHLQDDSPGSEINQYISSKFLKPEQFIGVDNDNELIKINRHYHPNSLWITGDWIDVIYNQENFDPAMIYLDTINELRSPIAARILCKTMWLCKPETLIIANFCANNPRKGCSGGDLFDEDVLINNIIKKEHPSLLKEWNKDKKTKKFRCVSYLYRTNKAWMRSYIFYRGYIDSFDLIEKVCA
jgi:hypothetical protein